MKDIKAFTGVIRQQAEAESAALLEEADSRRAESLSARKEALQKEYDDRKDRAAEWRRQDVETRVSAKRAAMAKELSAYRQQLTHATFQEAEEAMCAFDTASFTDFFTKAVAVVDEAGEYAVLVGERSLPAADFAGLKKISTAKGVKLIFSGESIPGEGGFVLRRGAVEYRFLFGDLLQDLEQREGSEIIRELFGDAKDED